MSGMTPEELREQIARALWDHENMPSDPEWREMAWADMGGPEPAQERSDAYLAADAVLAVVSPLLATARGDGAREALWGVTRKAMEDMRRPAGDSDPDWVVELERTLAVGAMKYATAHRLNHYPEKEKTDG